MSCGILVAIAAWLDFVRVAGSWGSGGGARRLLHRLGACNAGRLRRSCRRWGRLNSGEVDVVMKSALRANKRER
jgi:hypothetical protein